jgi:hypothetical protein
MTKKQLEEMEKYKEEIRQHNKKTTKCTKYTDEELIQLGVRRYKHVKKDLRFDNASYLVKDLQKIVLDYNIKLEDIQITPNYVEYYGNREITAEFSVPWDEEELKVEIQMAETAKKKADEAERIKYEALKKKFEGGNNEK